MTEDPTPDTRAKSQVMPVLCPECSEMLVEAHDPRAILLAAHLAQFCPATEGVLHA